jgi:hypothetical protein
MHMFVQGAALQTAHDAFMDKMLREYTPTAVEQITEVDQDEDEEDEEEEYEGEGIDPPTSASSLRFIIGGKVLVEKVVAGLKRLTLRAWCEKTIASFRKALRNCEAPRLQSNWGSDTIFGWAHLQRLSKRVKIGELLKAEPQLLAATGLSEYTPTQYIHKYCKGNYETLVVKICFTYLPLSHFADPTQAAAAARLAKRQKRADYAVENAKEQTKRLQDMLKLEREKIVELMSKQMQEQLKEQSKEHAKTVKILESHIKTVEAKIPAKTTVPPTPPSPSASSSSFYHNPPPPPPPFSTNFISQQPERQQHSHHDHEAPTNPLSQQRQPPSHHHTPPTYPLSHQRQQPSTHDHALSHQRQPPFNHGRGQYQAPYNTQRIFEHYSRSISMLN